ncbi:hypothetical protein ELS24_16060 [Achromobacter spanius]|nr:hypothetical protein ELS24_16060 [Achromobacter spanius]
MRRGLSTHQPGRYCRRPAIQGALSAVTIDFEETIKPFSWMEYEGNFSVSLNVGEYKEEVFRRRREEGFLGTGYDWTSLALVFLNEKTPELDELIDFDPEADTFCAYSSDSEALKTFALAFKAACEDRKLIQDLFSRAELD